MIPAIEILGLRYGLFGPSDIPPLTSLGVVLACCLALSWTTLAILKPGYKLRH